MLACVALLAACGGGGGSSSSPEPGPTAPPTPPPNPSGQLSATPDKIVLSAGQGEGQTVLKAYNLKDVSGRVAITLPDGSTLPAKEGANVPVMAKLGDNLYQLKDDKVLAKVTVTVSCGKDLEPDAASICQAKTVPPKVLHYDIIVARASDQATTPVLVTGDSCAKAKLEEAANHTNYPDNPAVYKNFVLFSARFYPTIMPSGKIYVEQQVVVEGNARKVFAWNPVANELTDLAADELPAPVHEDPAWMEISQAKDTVIGGWAQNDKLFVYVTTENGNRPLCEDVVNGVPSGQPVAFDLSAQDFGSFGGFFRFKH